jgi:glycosyltransferase involved in cell wall biosynthesis
MTVAPSPAGSAHPHAAVAGAPPRVSVVLATYDRERLVARAIDSVLAQTFTDFELLLVDDGSRDGTAEMIRSRYGAEPRLRYLPKSNGGSASARNHGIEHARGELLAFLDSDDRWLPRFLASQVALLARHPEAGLALCDAYFEGRWADRGPTLFSDRDFKAPVSMAAMMEGAWAIPTAWCVRREALDGIRFATRYRYCEDTQFLFQLAARRVPVVLNPELLAVYVHHEGGDGEGMKTAMRPEHELSHLRLLAEFAAYAPDPWALRESVFRRSRALAKALVGAGRWHDARPLLWLWFRKRPDSTHAMRWWFRSLFARSPRQGTTASASTSTSAAGS